LRIYCFRWIRSKIIERANTYGVEIGGQIFSVTCPDIVPIGYSRLYCIIGVSGYSTIYFSYYVVWTLATIRPIDDISRYPGVIGGELPE